MEERTILACGSDCTLAMEVRLEEDEEEFRSCCADEEEFEVEETEKHVSENVDLDEFSVRMFFKGVSIAEPGNTGSGLSGIGVVMERGNKAPIIQVQKKLDFYVEETVANYLALMDGLSEAIRNNIRRVFACTDSEILFDQITNEETPENPLVMALKQRILEHAGNLEHFSLKRVPDNDLKCPLQLAKVAVGIVSFSAKGDELVEHCSICCEGKLASMMFTMKCCHKFCSHCMKAYVDEKVESSQVPVRCPHLNCRYYISTTEFKSFLPVTSYELLGRALSKENVLTSDRLYCPFPNCSVLLDPRECLSTRVSLSNQSDNNCVECPVCRRFICLECGVPWHSSMSCEEYQDLPPEERDAGDITLAENRRWRRCQQCDRTIELTHGCYHMTCWCGHEFCYSCGAEYRESQQTCECAFWDEEEYSEELVAQHPAQQFEQWAWDSFGSLSTMMDAYSDQERSQLALIQRFLAGGFSLSDHHPYQSQSQSPPHCTDSSSYVDTIKDLHQLPWLERFVSVISDNYYDEYTQ